MTHQYWKNNQYQCSTDKSKLQIDIIHDFLSNRSYWAKGRTREQVIRSISHSECFGIYEGAQQVAFARVVTDFTIYAYILDVFVLERQQGIGLSKFLMNCIMNHSEMINIKRWMLGTEDAHGLYKKYGFTGLKKIENHMERVI